MRMQEKAQSVMTIWLRTLLFAFSLFSASFLVLQVSEWREGFFKPGVLSGAAILTTLVLASAYVAIRGRSSTAKRIVVELTALGAVLISVEIAIVAAMPNPRDARALRERAASRLGLPFDSRDVSEVVRGLRSKGIDALPVLDATWPLFPELRRLLPVGLYPLSHASNAVVVQCNESGRYNLYRSDEWGFNNPQGILAAGDIDVALVGESYFQGFCLPASQGFAGRIRKTYPRTANFAMAGNRLLGQLGSFREYVEPTRPRVVLWAVNPHFALMDEDTRDPTLARYLDPTYSQNLLARQRDIDRLVRTLAIPAQSELDRQSKIKARSAHIERFQRAWLLPETRAQIGRLVGDNKPAAKGPDLAEFVESLRLAKRATERWGGELIVVLLPIYAEVVAGQIEGNLRHDHLARVVDQLGISVVDGVELFEKHADPTALYTMRINNHPTAEGYALLADRVLAEIQAVNPQPPISAR